MPDLITLLNQGVRLADLPDHLRLSNLPRMAAVSIRAGLIAYFSTYRIAGISQVLSQDQRQAKNYEMFRQENSPNYLDAYSETILHLHHGIELSIKGLLRQKHPLLASSNLPTSAVLLCHVLHNKPISFEDEENLKSAEFSESLNRIIELEKEKLLEGDLSSMLANEALLRNLNKLRNRIIHRGLFVMDYSAFDLAVSAHILRFLVEFLALPQFENKANERVFSETTPPWKYQQLACGIDPLQEIVKISEDSEHNRRKLALLKEFGRAAFQNPLDSPGSRLAFSGINDSTTRSRAEQIAKHELSNPHPHAYDGANKVLTCPVCGLASLVRYNDGDGYDTDVICMCCTFNVKKPLGNARDYGLEIDDFWS